MTENLVPNCALQTYLVKWVNGGGGLRRVLSSSATELALRFFTNLPKVDKFLCYNYINYCYKGICFYLYIVDTDIE